MPESRIGKDILPDLLEAKLSKSSNPEEYTANHKNIVRYLKTEFNEAKKDPETKCLTSEPDVQEIETKLEQATVIECVHVPAQNATTSKCEIQYEESAQRSELSIKEAPIVSKAKKKRDARKNKKPKKNTNNFDTLLAEFGATAEESAAANSADHKPYAEKKETRRQKRERLETENQVTKLKNAIQTGKCGKNYMMGDVMAAIKEKAITAEEIKPFLHQALTEDQILISAVDLRDAVTEKLMDEKFIKNKVMNDLRNAELSHDDIMGFVNASFMTKEEVRPLVLKNIRTDSMKYKRTEIPKYVDSDIITLEDLTLVQAEQSDYKEKVVAKVFSSSEGIRNSY